jgi:hypothetical protein
MSIPPFPSGDEVSEVADWLELAVLNTGRPFRRGRLVTTLDRENAKVDAADVLDELERRNALMGTLWPLSVDDPTDAKVVSLRRNAPGRPLYTFFAALGLRQNITGQGRILFEHCVNELTAGLTGHSGIRIGHPREAPVPTSLREAIERYCADSAETEGRMKAPATTDQDMGMDVANWFPFTDNRGGYLHFVGQCATGADWPDKLTELSIRKLEDHIHWAVAPVRFFATPVVVTTQAFRRASLDGGLVLDRPRLVELNRRRPISAVLLRRVRTYTAALYD